MFMRDVRTLLRHDQDSCSQAFAEVSAIMSFADRIFKTVDRGLRNRKSPAAVLDVTKGCQPIVVHGLDRF